MRVGASTFSSMPRIVMVENLDDPQEIRKGQERLKTLIRLKASLRGAIPSGASQRPSSLKQEDIDFASEFIDTDMLEFEENGKEVFPSIPFDVLAKELKSLIGRTCELVYDKYQILEVRDKILSKFHAKSVGSYASILLKVICKDMCSEKERYMRIVQKRVSQYECGEGFEEMVPELAVKEYSRSAADQEQPLPHELRSIDVLENTMSYLIGRIASEVPTCDEDLVQWYDFLWSRTRAIRKDLSQQKIVNKAAVNLIEQCVRFHIFASHRLYHLGRIEFDQRMNTENLGKCLQSLRHLYDDLAKERIYCENEAEMRSYDILLNMNDLNILRLVLSYRNEIWHDPQVKLALHLSRVLGDGNHVKFFKLLKMDASYLQCCVCHRHFVELRSRALNVLCGSTKENTRYPLSKIVYFLGFNSNEDAIEYIRNHNLERETDSETNEILILLSKTSFYSSATTVQSQSEWIEKKRVNASVAQVLSGGFCKEFMLKSPLNSFDDQGNYVYDQIIQEYIKNCEDNFTEDEPSDAIVVNTSRESALGVEHTIRVEALVPQKNLNEVNDGNMDDAFTTQSLSRIDRSQLCEEMFNNICDQCTRLFVGEFFISIASRSQKRVETELQEQKTRELSRLQLEMTERMLDEVVNEMFREISSNIINEVKVHSEKVAHVSEVIYESLLNEILLEELNEIILNTICAKAEEAKKQKRLDQILYRVHLLWLKQFTDQWKNYVAKRKEKCEAERNFFARLYSVRSRQIKYSKIRRFSCIPSVGDDSEKYLEFKISVLRERRSLRIAKKVVTLWSVWAKNQKAKRNFFRSIYKPRRSLTLGPRKHKVTGRALSDNLKLALNESQSRDWSRYFSETCSSNSHHNITFSASSIHPESSDNRSDVSSNNADDPHIRSFFIRYDEISRRRLHDMCDAYISKVSELSCTSKKPKISQASNDYIALEAKMADFNTRLTDADVACEKITKAIGEMAKADPLFERAIDPS